MGIRFGSDGNILKILVMVVQHVNIIKTFKMNFMLCEF